MRRALVLAALLCMQNGVANEAADEQDDEPLPSDGSTPAAELRSAPAEDPSSTGDVQTDENSNDDGVG